MNQRMFSILNKQQDGPRRCRRQTEHRHTQSSFLAFTIHEVTDF